MAPHEVFFVKLQGDSSCSMMRPELRPWARMGHQISNHENPHAARHNNVTAPLFGLPTLPLAVWARVCIMLQPVFSLFSFLKSLHYIFCKFKNTGEKRSTFFFSTTLIHLPSLAYQLLIELLQEQDLLSEFRKYILGNTHANSIRVVERVVCTPSRRKIYFELFAGGTVPTCQRSLGSLKKALTAAFTTSACTAKGCVVIGGWMWLVSIFVDYP